MPCHRYDLTWQSWCSYPIAAPGRPTAHDFLWGCTARTSFKALEEKVAEAILADQKTPPKEPELKIPEGPLLPPRSGYSKPPPIGPDGKAEHLDLPVPPGEDKTPVDESKQAPPRPHDRYGQEDGPVDLQELRAVQRKLQLEKAEENNEFLAAKDAEGKSSAAQEIGKAADAESAASPGLDQSTRRGLSNAESAEEGMPRHGKSKTDSWNPGGPGGRGSQNSGPKVEPRTAGNPNDEFQGQSLPPPPPPEPRKVTMEEAQQGVYVPGEIEPYQTRMYNPFFHL